MTVLPTQTAPLTSEGTILGTLQYMAPEQLEGREADSRTDIFALGSVIYEMATGRKAFGGKGQASLISAIMTSEPPSISSLQPIMPAALHHVVRTCMAKEPETRWQSAHDVLVELKWIVEVGTQTDSTNMTSGVRHRGPMFWALLAISVVGAIAVALMHFREPQREQPAVRFLISPPEKTLFTNMPAISPDGRTVAFVAGAPQTSLWVRNLDTTTAQEVPGTEDAAIAERITQIPTKAEDDDLILQSVARETVLAACSSLVHPTRV